MRDSSLFTAPGISGSSARNTCSQHWRRARSARKVLRHISSTSQATRSHTASGNRTSLNKFKTRFLREFPADLRLIFGASSSFLSHRAGDAIADCLFRAVQPASAQHFLSELVLGQTISSHLRHALPVPDAIGPTGQHRRLTHKRTDDWKINRDLTRAQSGRRGPSVLDLGSGSRRTGMPYDYTGLRSSNN